MQREIGQTMEFANNVLKSAALEGMLIEVVVWAIDGMKSNPSMTIEEAIEYGYNEWVK